MDGRRWYSQATGGSVIGTQAQLQVSVSATTTFYFAAYKESSGCETEPRIPVAATVNPIPGSPTVGGNARFGPGPISLSGSGTPSGGTYKWYSLASGGDLLYTGNPYATGTVGETTNNYVFVSSAASDAGCEGPRTAVNVKIYPIPEIRATSAYIAQGEPVTLTSNESYDTYNWKMAGSEVVLSDQESYSTNQSGSYTLTVTKGGISKISDPFALGAQFDGLNMNYVITYTLQDGDLGSLPVMLDGLPVEKVNQSIQYYDGLGRPIQTVITQGSPTKKDIVQPIVYDEFGREAKKYLPFTAVENNGRYKEGIFDSNGDYTGAALNFYNNSNDDIADDPKPFAVTVFEPSPLNRLMKQGAAGAAWQPNASAYPTADDHVIKFEYDLNDSSDVLLWTYTYPTASFPLGRINAGTGATPVYYAAKKIYKNRAKDEHQNEVIEFLDQQGKTLLKKVQYAPNEYASTYYIYDDFSNLVCVIQPEGVKNIEDYFAADDTGREEFLSKWAFRYRYDGRRRKTHAQVPGSGVTYRVFDKRDRVVLTQDANQRAANQWHFIKYDQLNLPVITGIYVHNDSIDQAQMSALISATAFAEQYDNTKPHGYTTDIFPNSNLTIHTVTFYDNYAFRDDLAGSGYNYVPGDLTGQAEAFGRVKGLVTGTKTNILGTNDYLWSVNYYDDKYRVIQTITQNHKGGADRVTNKVDFTGKVLETKTTHSNSTTTQTIKKRYKYDHVGRLLKTYHKVNSGPEIILAAHEYNELGQLVTKKLHSMDNGNTFRQHVDYRYNIRGWMTRINDSSAPGDDYFSMELKYNDPTASGGDAQFNGNISETIWKTYGNDRQSYGYEYDPMNRMLSAEYFNVTTPAQNGRYNETIGTTGRPAYDMNGNLLNVLRNGRKDDNAYGLMDDLAYDYGTQGNKLVHVADAIASQPQENGFKEATEGSEDYAYDDNGNMTLDANKGITSIEYNHLKLPKKVLKSPTEYIAYTYDATGRKLSQQVFGTEAKTTDYNGEFVYEDNVLQFVQHGEGRVVPKVGNWEYQYHLKDHLGNVRLTFSSASETETTTATLEAANLSEEQGQYLRYEHARRVQATLFDRTNGTSIGYSQRLNGSANEIYGLARSISVMPGDTVNAEAYAKYIDEEPGDWSQALVDLMSAIANNTGGIVVDGGGYGGSTSSFSFGGYVNTSGSSETAPKAFLNWIVFDRDFNMLDGGFDQISTAAKETGTDVAHDRLFKDDIIVTEPGYVYIYLSNENETPVEVFFDDFRVEHIKSPVVQVDDYYPFGLTFNSYERENSVKQRWKFQGQEHIDDLGLNWDSFKWRNHQPDIGRFFNIDPLAEKYVHNSPYAFSENKVTSHVELEGLESITIHGTRQGITGSSFSKEAVIELRRIGGNTKSDNSFRWNSPLNNKERDRKEAATALVSHVVKVRSEMIESGQITAEEPVTLVGYSHGGNVAIQAIEQISETLGTGVNLITVSTPAYNENGDNENPAGKSGINQHIQIIHEKDGVTDGLALGSDTYTNSRSTNYVVEQKEVEIKDGKGIGPGVGILSHTQLPSHPQFDDYLKKIPTMSNPK